MDLVVQECDNMVCANCGKPIHAIDCCVSHGFYVCNTCYDIYNKYDTHDDCDDDNCDYDNDDCIGE